jgi:prophage regulatory protein
VKLLRPRACATALGVSTVTLWRWQKAGGFPRPFRIGKQAIAWDEGEVLAWLETRRDTRGHEPVSTV